MPFKLIPNPSKASDDTIISFCAVVMAFIFFKYILPSIEKRFQLRVEKMTNVRNALKLSDKFKLDKSICSKQCCHLGVIPEHLIPEGPIPKEELKNYVKDSGYSCRNGCRCVHKKLYNLIGDRGVSAN
jgi:hypothetical protein